MKIFIFFIALAVSVFCQAQSALQYFSNYEENKKDFLQKSFNHWLQTWYLKSDATLTTDLAFYNYNANQILVISSGLHGIEGYVGSAVQRKLMDVLNTKKRLGYDILMVHSLNPWGMRNKRRVNEFNVDMNRNFSADSKLYSSKNEDYTKISSFLNPTNQVNLNILHRLGFLFDSVLLILKNGIEPLRRSILAGQYTESKGLYFGGDKQNPLQDKIDLLFQNELKKYKKVVWIDLHTGYGEKGKLHLLTNDSEPDQIQKLSQLFNQRPIDSGAQKNFYKTTGDLTSYLQSKTNQKQEVYSLAFEYGTLDSQKTLGSIESLRRMVIENQGFHFKYLDNDSEKETHLLFQEMFFPQDEIWKKSIYEQTIETLNPFLKEVNL